MQRRSRLSLGLLHSPRQCGNVPLHSAARTGSSTAIYILSMDAGYPDSQNAVRLLPRATLSLSGRAPIVCRSRSVALASEKGSAALELPGVATGVRVQTYPTFPVPLHVQVGATPLHVAASIPQPQPGDDTGLSFLAHSGMPGSEGLLDSRMPAVRDSVVRALLEANANVYAKDKVCRRAAAQPLVCFAMNVRACPSSGAHSRFISGLTHLNGHSRVRRAGGSQRTLHWMTR